MLKEGTPKSIHLKDYKPCAYTITDIHLTFHLHSTETLVQTKLKVEHNPASQDKPGTLTLNGEELKFVKAKIDGRELSQDEYELGEESLKLKNVPEAFLLEIENIINPEANKALDGLYKSGNIFCTQNEPEGFRRITYYLDRPDIMAKFTTKIIADKEKYPVMLSNGNPIGEGEAEDGKHWVEWQDPFPKPCYLYALVAGDLGLVQDSYKTQSGRTIDLRIYCDKGNESRCFHAMESLKKSMKWDEETFGLEYDLDIYMIVAVDSFNMGAMENKGLNIFNSVFVLADEVTATDNNFLGIESVVGHEYFHNWTGNRITCRDWFQLTLKEGLTVYRDQEFSSDLNSRTVQRIQDVERLRTVQFVEDAGPTAHPIKPTSYIEINNFYTATIYEKGAEVIRMVRTMLSKEGFRKGMDKYFELYDGQAVTTEEFLHAMSVANGDFDFSQFKNWYKQAGTPVADVSWNYKEDEKVLELTINQSCPPTPGQDHKEPFHFPLALGLLDKNGTDMTLNLREKDKQPQLSEGIIHITKESETFVFVGVSEAPVVSINRGFSAPVKIQAPYHLNDLTFMMAKDTDMYNRYEAVQTASSRLIAGLLKDKAEGKELILDESFVHAYGELLKDHDLDPAVKAMLLSIPSTELLAQGHRPIDYKALYDVRYFVVETLARTHKELFHEVYNKTKTPGEYQLDPISVGKRSLRKRALSYLSYTKTDEVKAMALAHMDQATNMTEELGAFGTLAFIGGTEFEKASKKFYDKWKDNTLVMQKWLVTCASSPNDETFEKLTTLENDPVYDKTVPNLVRSLVGGFGKNVVQFHHESGRGYKYMANKIMEVDEINPQVASRLASLFRDYKKLIPEMQEKMKPHLEAILTKPKVSKNVYEIVSKILKS